MTPLQLASLHGDRGLFLSVESLLGGKIRRIERGMFDHTAMKRGGCIASLRWLKAAGPCSSASELYLPQVRAGTCMVCPVMPQLCTFSLGTLCRQTSSGCCSISCIPAYAQLFTRQLCSSICSHSSAIPEPFSLLLLVLCSVELDGLGVYTPSHSKGLQTSHLSGAGALKTVVARRQRLTFSSLLCFLRF